ncbi:AglZ/HisF2 family acetamidino modification protein [Candidatus Accumulibacter sp. ACC007]|uniref:AglZ/HisF2 family acetamidino modification protein n=1 Tax=Candidatus Accumulibacter sp. ACC007 TaxID=2823333 RepID=UPI0025C4FED2|nr:AglZ/HisF2 family acetamidino modification protein [Candidatus Accumulibacter sp. ACC007]
MHKARVIPCLLLDGQGLVKTIRFQRPVYVGDPINAVRIFSEKEVDELIVLDITASRDGRDPNYELIAEIAGECFMPVAYGGGLHTLDQVKHVIRSGIEKVVINTAAIESYRLITEASQVFGSQAVIGAVDVKRGMLGYKVVGRSATTDCKIGLNEHVQNLVTAGAGEIFLNSVDRDGMMEGYDLKLIAGITKAVSVPVVACGGAGTLDHLVEAVREGGASAVAAGSLFVFHGKHRAVLINYPVHDIRRHLALV